MIIRTAAQHGRSDHRPQIDLEPAPRGRLDSWEYRFAIDRNFTFATSLVAALARLGVRHAAVTPGSRNTPLTLALTEHLRDWSHHDERSAAFFALGLAKATGMPVVVCCTSGTAVAELYPAMIEARYGRVPLVALTADRPTDLLGTGAPQTIDQRDLYATNPKWSADVEAEDDAISPVDLAEELVAAALSHPPGPVHLTVRFREPLIPTGAPAQSDQTPDPRHPPPGVPTDPTESLSESIGGRRTLVVCGPQDDPELPGVLGAWAARTGIPIVADPLSRLRAGPHDRSRVVATGDVLATAGFWDRARPEVVLRVGALPTSKPIWAWLDANPSVAQIAVDPTGWRDPTGSIGHLNADPATLFAGLDTAPAPQDWTDRWTAADAAAARALADTARAQPFPNEPGVVRAMAETIPDGSVLHTASSMPIRDVDLMFPSTERSVWITSNRGANGVDGFISSGLGIAAAEIGTTYLLAGDLSALHDLTALATAARLHIPVLVVVINNDGGGIFHFLPQAGFPDETFERHWGTPHGVDFVAAAEALGVAARQVGDPGELEAAVADRPHGPRLLEVRTDRRDNVGVHSELRAAAAAALESAGL